MKRISIRSRAERGGALISALAVVAMSSLLMTGVCLLATSQSARQTHEADYKLALQMAEAGVNYEINYYANNNTAHVGTYTSSASMGGSYYTGSIPGVTGLFKVCADKTQPTLITSSGTVGSGAYAITRTVQVAVSGSSIFNGTYTVFGTTSVAVNGNAASGTVASNSSVTGTLKTGSTGTCKNHCSDSYDTVDNICSRQFTHGWDDLDSDDHVTRQCSHMRCLTSSWTPYWNCTQTCDWGSTGTKTHVTDSQCAQLPSNILILCPGDQDSTASDYFSGDYYFTNFQCTNNTNLYCDSNCNSTSAADCPNITPGPVRIWCGGNEANDDKFCTSFNCTSNQNSCQPRCMYGKSQTCTITQNQSSCTAGFYAVKCGKSGSCTHSRIVCDGCTKSCKGTIIGDDVTVNSNSFTSTSTPLSSVNISHPTDATAANGFGFSGSWVELKAPSAGAVFADGSNS